MNASTAAFIHLQFLRDFLLPLPGVTEDLSHGTPAFSVNNKRFARLWENGETLVLHSVERDKWIAAKPDVFFVTDHYINYDYVLVNLNTVSPEHLKEVLLTAWKNRANKTSLRLYEAGQNNS